MFSVPYLWYQADMDVAEVLPLHLELELPEGLDEGHALNVPHGASQLLTHNTSLAHRTACTNTQVGSHTFTNATPLESTNIISCTEPIILSELVLLNATITDRGRVNI